MHRTQRGFTLIELSVVLVIIGLIIGGVVVGRDLIKASEARATITQIEKYNTAANTFREKYSFLPGDINATAAAQFGFIARGQYAGQGDGNGLIEGVWGNSRGKNQGEEEEAGETVVFWTDLSTARMIDGSFQAASICCRGSEVTAIDTYLPAAKLGQGNYIYVFSSGQKNYFGLSAVTAIGSSAVEDVWGDTSSTPSLSVQQAYEIDRKIDDGLPQSGNVLAQYINGAVLWVGASAWDRSNPDAPGPLQQQLPPAPPQRAMTTAPPAAARRE
ncbi:MAG: prepilin-type N-terminal cleavage/methylation domain-containing protein [Bryobacteraceae bacterium]